MKRIIFFTIIVVATLSIVHSISSIYELWQKRSLISQSQQELIQAQNKNKKLKQQLQAVSSPLFVEEEARDKLFMIKPAEQTVFIDKSLLSQRQTVLAAKANAPIWQQWWNLFFN